MFENPSILLDREFGDESLLNQYQNVLVVNFVADGLLPHLAKAHPKTQFVGFSYNFANVKNTTAAFVGDSLPNNLELTCTSELKTSAEFDAVVIYFPKSKDEFNFTLHNVLALTKLDAPIWVVGDNKGGVKTCDKMLQQFCPKARKINSAKHCALYQTSLQTKPTAFDINKWFKHFELTINGKTIKVSSLPGVFSHGSLDIGTDILLNNLPIQPAGKILDFGCGVGIIGSFLAAINPSIEVTGLDVSALAITSSEQTFANNGVNGKCILSDGLSELLFTKSSGQSMDSSGQSIASSGQSKFNQVIINPPFHTGIKTDYAVTEGFIAQIKQFIEPRGSLTIVANSFLKYQPLLEQQFGSFNTVFKDKRFSVYHAQVN